jgi:hypothetical protein
MMYGQTSNSFSTSIIVMLSGCTFSREDGAITQLLRRCVVMTFRTGQQGVPVCLIASDMRPSQHVAICVSASDRTRSGVACMY